MHTRRSINYNNSVYAGNEYKLYAVIHVKKAKEEEYAYGEMPAGLLNLQ